MMLYYAARECGPVLTLLMKITSDRSSIHMCFMLLSLGVLPLLIGTVATLPTKRILWPNPSSQSAPDYPRPKDNGKHQGIDTGKYQTAKKLPRNSEKYQPSDSGKNQPGDNEKIQSGNSKKHQPGDHGKYQTRSGLDPGNKAPISASRCCYKPFGSVVYWSQVMWFVGIVTTLRVTQDLAVYRSAEQSGDWFGTTQRLFLFSCLITLVTCSLTGISLDRFSNYKEESKRRKTFFSSITWVTSIIGLSVQCLLVVSFVSNDILTDICVSVSRGLSAVGWGTHAVVIATLFPYDHFGRLLGMSTALAEVLVLPAYGLAYLVQQRWVSQITLLIVQCCVVSMTFLHVIWKWRAKNTPLATFCAPNVVMETMARAGLTLNGVSSAHSIEMIEPLETEDLE